MHGALQRKGIASGTIRIAHGILASALEAAVDQGLVPFNVCRKAGRPRQDDEEMKSLTSEQATAFLKAAKADRLHALYVLAIAAGRSQGELFGLKRDDIDLGNNYFSPHAGLDKGRRVCRESAEVEAWESNDQPGGRRGRGPAGSLPPNACRGECRK